MATAAVMRALETERGLAQTNERRSPQAGVSFDSVYSSTVPSEQSQSGVATQTANASSGSSNYLKWGIAAPLVAICLFLIFWRWRIQIRQKNHAKSVSGVQVFVEKHRESTKASRFDLEACKYDEGIEEPVKVLYFPSSPLTPPGVGWQPQIRSIHGPVVEPPPSRQKSVSSQKAWEKTLRKFRLEDASQSSPPAYSSSGPYQTQFLHAQYSPEPRTPTSSQSLPSTPSVPRYSVTLPKDEKSISTRSSSLDPSVVSVSALSDKRSSVTRPVDRRLPRLMTVTTTFTPKFADELSIEVGDILRLLEEYEDDWCLVERVESGGVVSGVIPRLCIGEFSAPIHPKKHL